MLAPYCELEKAEPAIAKLGVASIPLWKGLIQEWCPEAGALQDGTVSVAFFREEGELTRLKRSIDQFDPQATSWLDIHSIQKLLPAVSDHIRRALWIPGESYLDGALFLETLRQKLAQQKKVTFHTGTDVTKIEPHTIETSQGKHTYSWVIDCRGLAAKPDIKNLRPVRGEIIRVYAPEVNVVNTIRLMHPRYPIYIVPRGNNHFLIGATSIESALEGGITVLSTLELLSAAYSLHSGFGEAQIVDTFTGLRPAFPDNTPRVFAQKGLIRINGLYRHGYLVGPIVTKAVSEYCETESIEPSCTNIFVESRHENHR